MPVELGAGDGVATGAGHGRAGGATAGRGQALCDDRAERAAGHQRRGPGALALARSTAPQLRRVIGVGWG
jgi:hypothetical protein